jgi:hypothetical protein
MLFAGLSSAYIVLRGVPGMAEHRCPACVGEHDLVSAALPSSLRAARKNKTGVTVAGRHGFWEFCRTAGGVEATGSS